MQRLIAIIVGFLLLISPAMAEKLNQQELTAISRLLITFKDAFNEGNAGLMIETMPPKLLAKAANRDVFKLKVTASLDHLLTARKMHIESISLRPPGDSITVGNAIIVIIPTLTDMRQDGKQLRISYFWVASRNKDSADWKILDGDNIYSAPNLLSSIFPGFPADFKFPERKVETIQ